MSISDVGEDLHNRLILDGTKISHHMDRVRAWENGEWFPPTTIDMALTPYCNYSCGFCYAQLQKNQGFKITTKHAIDFIDDCAEVGVRGVSLVSDGESTLSPAYVPIIQRGHALGVSMASGTNAFAFDRAKLESVLPCLTYLRVNFSAGERDRYAQIMGTKPGSFDKVCENVRMMMEIKRRDNLPVTIGLQMVLMPQDSDQIMPFARLGAELGVDYSVIKHTSDGPDGELGVDYSKYPSLYEVLHEAESASTPTYKVVVKWRKIKDGSVRSYKSCYGAPHLLQISGTGLVAPCGMMFATKYAKHHIANITEQRFRDIVHSERYWEVVRHLASPDFDTKDCGQLCLQHYVNVALDEHKSGRIPLIPGDPSKPPMHLNFI